MTYFDLPERTEPRVSPQLFLGAASPLWGYFGAAAAGGVAFWWMTRWARPVNLEALLGAAPGADVVLDEAVEVVEAAVATLEPLPEVIAEAGVEAEAEAEAFEAAFEAPEATVAEAAKAAPETAPEPVVAAAPEPMIEAKAEEPPPEFAPEPVLAAEPEGAPDTIVEAQAEAAPLVAKPRTRKATSPVADS